MKNIKKLPLCLLTSAILFTGVSTSICADEKSVDVTYGSDDSFEWSIPTSINLNGTETTASNYGKVEITSCKITPKKKIVVKYDSNNSTSLASTADSTKVYDFIIGSDSGITSSFDGGDTILTVPADYDSTKMSVDIYGKIANDPHKYAGEFKTTIKFTASIVNE